MTTLYHFILTLHILSFIAFIGGIIFDYLLFVQFWKQYRQDFAKAKTVWELKTKVSAVMRFGGVMAFLAGIGLMVFMHGVYGEQAWMKIKLPLVVLAVINIIVLSGRQRKLTGNDMGNNIPFSPSRHHKTRSGFTFFYIVEFFLVCAIVLLSAFRFT